MIRRVTEFLKKSYYNTNQEEGTTLAASEGRATKQESLVYDYLKEEGECFPRFELEKIFGWPTQTMSRVLANLTSEGMLEKTDHMVKGPFNKMVHTWKVKVL